MAAPRRAAIFSNADPSAGMAAMKQDWADRIGRNVSAFFIVLLVGFFAYAYLGHFLLG